MSDQEPTDDEKKAAYEEYLKRKQLEEHEVSEVVKFLKKWGVALATILLIIAGVSLGTNLQAAKQSARAAKADNLMRKAKSAADFETIVRDYPSTKAAELALLEMAKAKFHKHELEAAEKYFSKFIAEYSDSELVPQAELNLIACIEGREQFDDAQRRYAAFAGKHSDSFLAPTALIGQARCLEQLGKWSDARIIYEDIKVNYPNSNWPRIADRALLSLKGKE